MKEFKILILSGQIRPVKVKKRVKNPVETFIFPGGWYVHILSGRIGDLWASLSLASLLGPFIHFNVSLNGRTSDTSKQHQSAAAASREHFQHISNLSKKVSEFLQRCMHVGDIHTCTFLHKRECIIWKKGGFLRFF
jgi:hypothetical protein